MEAKVVLRKGPLRKVLHLTGRKVVDSTYFPRPIIADSYYKYHKKRLEENDWVEEVKEKKKLIIVPGESNEMIQKGYKNGI